MGRIVISENVSLDGVVEDPTGEEGFRHGGWFEQIGDKDREAWAKVGLDEALGAAALLLGRRSYEFLAARWPSRSGEWADRLNSLPKYVVSSTLVDPDWNNSTVLRAMWWTRSRSSSRSYAGKSSSTPAVSSCAR